MNKNVFLFALGFVLIMISCGPAAEDRRAMHERAKVFQDSIASVIRATIAEAEGPAPIAPVIAPATPGSTVVPPTPTK